jgi:hypothetical protein
VVKSEMLHSGSIEVSGANLRGRDSEVYCFVLDTPCDAQACYVVSFVRCALFQASVTFR